MPGRERERERKSGGERGRKGGRDGGSAREKEEGGRESCREVEDD